MIAIIVVMSTNDTENARIDLASTNLLNPSIKAKIPPITPNVIQPFFNSSVLSSPHFFATFERTHTAPAKANKPIPNA